MTLKQLLDIATSGYGDGTLEMMYNQKTGKTFAPSTQIRKGDGLAMFVVNELADTFSPELTDELTLTAAIDAMEGGIRDLQDVIEAMEKAKNKIGEP